MYSHFKYSSDEMQEDFGNAALSSIKDHLSIIVNPVNLSVHLPFIVSCGFRCEAKTQKVYFSLHKKGEVQLPFVSV